MEKDSSELVAGSPGMLSTGWFDPIEAAVRDKVRGFIKPWWQRRWMKRSAACATSAAQERRTEWWAGPPATDMDSGNASCSVHSAR